MKPICVPCQRFYRMKKSGRCFIEGMPIADRYRDAPIPPGTEAPENWKPYKLWSGDLWECKGCGHQLISGTGVHPVAEHYQPDFDSLVMKCEADYQVNDC